MRTYGGMGALPHRLVKNQFCTVLRFPGRVIP